VNGLAELGQRSEGHVGEVMCLIGLDAGVCPYRRLGLHAFQNVEEHDPITHNEGLVLVRDTIDREGGALTCSATAWGEFSASFCWQ
jgi:hypothetical protein